jgi:MinD-like ATPase involved in chromosome partitioning or flagellar assembly
VCHAGSDRGIRFPVKTMLGVCTTRAGQTSTYWATALAWTLAESRSVMLVDCDMEGGTIADLLYLDIAEKGLANCFGDRPAAAADLSAQAVAVPHRANLNVIPGLRGTVGFEITECLYKLGSGLQALDCDMVIADLGHPLAHPGLRSPRAAAQAICAVFQRVFVVVRDEPALMSRSIDVLRAARLAHGELIICRQRSRSLRRLLVESIERELPDLAIRDGWSWDASRAARVAETGRPMTLNGVAMDLHL